MPAEKNTDELLLELAKRPRATLAQLPTPIHRLDNFGGQLDGQELWMKRDDLTGLEGGGNKTRKLEFLVGDAIESGCRILLMHLGGTPAVHAYANQFDSLNLSHFPV